MMIAFLQNANSTFEGSSPTPGQSLVHLSLWKKRWDEDEPDLIVMYHGPMNAPGSLTGVLKTAG
jgi:hypothetical protein